MSRSGRKPELVDEHNGYDRCRVSPPLYIVAEVAHRVVCRRVPMPARSPIRRALIQNPDRLESEMPREYPLAMGQHDPCGDAYHGNYGIQQRAQRQPSICKGRGCGSARNSNKQGRQGEHLSIVRSSRSVDCLDRRAQPNTEREHQDWADVGQVSVDQIVRAGECAGKQEEPQSVAEAVSQEVPERAPGRGVDQKQNQGTVACRQYRVGAKQHERVVRHQNNTTHILSEILVPILLEVECSLY